MTKTITLCASVTCLALLSSCASIKPPERPDYAGADTVSTANPGQIAGVWRVKSLNPYPQEEPQSTTIEYRDDGTVIGILEPQGDSSDALGNLRFELTGSWTLAEDVISHTDIEINSTSDNAMGAMVSKIMSGSKAIAGKGNIYELSDNRMVVVGDDGAAMEYIRQ